MSSAADDPGRGPLPDAGVPGEAVAALLGEAGLGGSFTLAPIAGGTNNRVFRLEAGGQAALLKAYFHRPDDPRDRLKAEYSFCRFAWDRGVGRVPRPLACDPAHHLGLYEFVEGRKITPGEIDGSRIDEAADFFYRLNEHRLAPEAAALPVASEAAFSLEEHLGITSGRVGRLNDIVGKGKADRAARAFVKGELLPSWIRVESSARDEARRAGMDASAPLSEGSRRVSPSDFGFDNSILEPSGRLRFIDFEYSGWDDPAKAACDLFVRPAFPLDLKYLDRFAWRALGDAPEGRLAIERARLLVPVYVVKWCCILLNEFVPAGLGRRAFADAEAGQDGRKLVQLEKARKLMERLSGMSRVSGGRGP